MADHNVMLNYTAVNDVETILETVPDTISVSEGETIMFSPGDGLGENGFRITFNEPEFFSVPHFDLGGDEVKVSKQPTHLTSYTCELVSSHPGKPADNPNHNRGGKIEPATDSAHKTTPQD